MEGTVELVNSLKQIKQKVDAAWQIDQQLKKHKGEEGQEPTAAAAAALQPAFPSQVPFGTPGA